jgi:hypothetical protein
MRLLFLVAFCFVFLPVSRASQQSDASKTSVFPAISAYNLDKVKVTIPAEFEGKVNLLLISFEAEQAKDIDTWMPLAQALQHMNFDFRYYKLPVSNPENAIYRWWDSSSMRSVETDPVMWHWIIPLYINKDEFRRSLMIQNEKEIVAMLVDKAGHVLWKATGRLNEDNKSSLTAAVATATQH